jgi:hypothetical protein
MHIVMSEAVLTTANGGILHYISPGALDGFAIGALLSGLILLLMVPRLMRRAQPQGMFREYFATPADGGQFAGALEASRERAAAAGLDDIGDADTDSYDAGELDELEQVAQDEEPPDAPPEDADATPEDADAALRDAADTDTDPGAPDPADSASGGHRSKHRMRARPGWRVDVRRGRPRHAARSGALST